MQDRVCIRWLRWSLWCRSQRWQVLNAGPGVGQVPTCKMRGKVRWVACSLHTRTHRERMRPRHFSSSGPVSRRRTKYVIYTTEKYLPIYLKRYRKECAADIDEDGFHIYLWVDRQEGRLGTDGYHWLFVYWHETCRPRCWSLNSKHVSTHRSEGVWVISQFCQLRDGKLRGQNVSCEASSDWSAPGTQWTEWNKCLWPILLQGQVWISK